MTNSRNKYSDEEILKQLKEHYQKNLGISVKSFTADKEACSVRTVTQRFGSWKNALEKAGLKEKELKKYRDKDILEQIRKYYMKNGKHTREGFDKDRTVCSSWVVFNRFGSWENALKKAGIKPRIKLTRELVTEQLKECYARNGRIDKEIFDKDKETCSSSHVAWLFGGWNKALEETELKAKKEYVEYDKTKLLEILREKVKTGEFIHRNDVEDIKGIPSYEYIKKLWSWKELSQILGLKRKVHKYTKKEIIEKYKEVKNELSYWRGKFSYAEFNEITGIGNDTIVKYFGSIRNFINEIKEKEMQELKKVTHTKEEILKMYKEYSIKIGKGDTGASQNEIDEGFIYKSSVLGKRFGGLNALRELLGMEIKYPSNKKYTKEELTEKLLEKYNEYGRILSQSEIKKLGKEEGFPGGSTFLSYFQTTKMSEVWAEVLKNKETLN